ncbi:MAG: hypothetical protein RLZZ543_1458 [Bacteroidota bacterium]|jgi:penicillin-binding protein 1C
MTLREKSIFLFQWLKAFFQSKKRRRLFACILLLIAFIFCLPNPIFDVSYSTVITSKDGKLLGARIAEDGQWRFPGSDTIPEKFEACLLTFEDKHFYQHPGINPVSMGRAAWQNIMNGRVLSGGSTLSMQVMRLSRKGQKRSILEKAIESIQAVRLECSYSKRSILALYAQHAPFGGNVVGLEAAAWRYFGRNANELTWAESATLAVLPNAPSLIFPGKNQEKLRIKRDGLLKQLFAEKIIDEETLQLSLQEPLPGKAFSIPTSALQLLNRVEQEQGKGRHIQTSIDARLQQSVQAIVQNYKDRWEANGVHNAGVLVLDVEQGKTLAYVGNVQDAGLNRGASVDMINAERSTGSILKPLLFAAMLQYGKCLPTSLQADVPTQIDGYSPKNYNLTFDGAVPARKAISRSLNVPAVRMLQQLGIERFNNLLRKLGMTTLRKSAAHYGLSLILGGAEGKLWDLCGIYASLARQQNHFASNNGKYFMRDVHPPSYLQTASITDKGTLSEHSLLDAGAVYEMLEAMAEVNRPDEEAGWTEFLSAQKVAWKTGTSFGHRDAWAIGVTPRYVVGVWVGNASGEGKPLLTGVGAAAPVLFDVLGLLPRSGWFDRPYDDEMPLPLCHESGFIAGNYCDVIDTIWVPKSGMKTTVCPYHKRIHLDPSGRFRADADCVDPDVLQQRSWFVLPPAMEFYYRTTHPSYLPLPDWMPGCGHEQDQVMMEFIYPRKNSEIIVPRSYNGLATHTVMEIAHRNPAAVVYWHLDGKFVGKTQHFHQLALQPSSGEHLLVAVDEQGEKIQRRFKALKN